MTQHPKQSNQLPPALKDYIKSLINQMPYREKVCEEVRNKLTGHYINALSDCKTDEEKNARAQTLIEQFDDPKLLAQLIRRAKKRCRPLWKKAIIRSLQGIALLVLLIIAQGLTLNIGTANISTDYVQWLTDLGKQDRDDSLNAKPYYDKAIELHTPWSWSDPNVEDLYKSWPDQWSPRQIQTVNNILKNNTEAIDWLRKGANQPHYWRVYGQAPRDDDSISHIEPESSRLHAFEGYEGFMEDISSNTTELQSYKSLAKILSLEIKMNAFLGNLNKAVTDSMVLQKFGMHQQGKGFLLEQVVGIALEALAIDNIFQLLNGLDVSDEILRNMHVELENLYHLNNRPINIEAEKVMFLDYVQRTFTDDGNGNGRMKLEGIPVATGDTKGILKGFVLGFPDRREVLYKFHSLHQHCQDIIEQTPWELQSQPSEFSNGDIYYNQSWLLQIFSPALTPSGPVAWRLKASRGALLTVIALKRWKLEVGEYPDSLEELIDTGFLKELPGDPYRDGPMTYKNQGDDFILYSYAIDFDDDNGLQYTKKTWEENESGDLVFWPPSY